MRAAFGPHETLFTRWTRWGETGIFAPMFVGLAAEHVDQKTVVRSTWPAHSRCAERQLTHPTSNLSAQLERHKRGRGRLIHGPAGYLAQQVSRQGPDQGGLKTKLHAPCDRQECPLNLCVAAGQASQDLAKHIASGQWSAAILARGPWCAACHLSNGELRTTAGAPTESENHSKTKETAVCPRPQAAQKSVRGRPPPFRDLCTGGL